MALRQDDLEVQGCDLHLDEEFRRTRPPSMFTHRTIDALAPEATAYRVPDARCPGLAIRVAPNGLRTWDLAFRVRGSGKFRRLSLGRFPDVGLEAARDRATELTRAARAGRDHIGESIAANAAAEKRITVEELLALYLERRVKGRLRTAKEIGLTLSRALASVRQRYADEMRRRDFRDIFDAVAARGVLREAEKERQSVTAMFRWALAQDYIEIDPTAGLQSYGPVPRRDRVLSPDEIKILWQWLTSSGFPYPDVLKLQLALGARCGEICGMCAEEIDQATWLWTLPAERSKNKRSRTTPLVGIAREIVAARLAANGRGPLFFSENDSVPLRTGHVAAVLVKRKKKLPISDFTTHDMRRTFATQLAEMNVPYDLIAAIVGHEAGKGQRTLTVHYIRAQRLEAKKMILTAWNERLAEYAAQAAGLAPTGTLALPAPEIVVEAKVDA